MAHGQATATIAAPPEVVFGAITDVARLPEWNAVMTDVVEKPTALVPGAQWVVAFHVMGRSWHSRATVEDYDIEHRRFSYRSGTDDGNPSYATWTWTVEPEGEASRVTVEWDLHPVTFWRRTLLVKVRSRQLTRSEVPGSLAALAAHVATPQNERRV